MSIMRFSLFFTFICTFFGIDARIVDIKKATLDDKSVFLFADLHDDEFALSIDQKKPLELFFNQNIRTVGDVTLLLEGVRRYKDELSMLEDEDTQLLKDEADQTFFHSFYKYADDNGDGELDIRDDLNKVVIKDWDERKEIDLAVPSIIVPIMQVWHCYNPAGVLEDIKDLPADFLNMRLSSLALECRQLCLDLKSQVLESDMAGLFRSEGKEWFDSVSTRVETIMDLLRPLIKQNAWDMINERAQILIERALQGLVSITYNKSKDCSRLLSDAVDFLLNDNEIRILFDARQALNDMILFLSDISLLYQIVAASNNVIVVEAGQRHVNSLTELLSRLGYTVEDLAVPASSSIVG